MSSTKNDNEERAARRIAYETYLKDLEDDLRRLLAANAPTQAQTEIKTRNVRVFGKVLRKQYPELKVEAVDISAGLYATDLRHFPLEVTFNLTGVMTGLKTDSEFHPLYDPHVLLKVLSDGNMPVRIQSPPSKPEFDFQIHPPSPVHQLRTCLLQQYAQKYQNMRDLVSILLLINRYSYCDPGTSPVLVAFCVAAFYDSISVHPTSGAPTTPRTTPSMTIPFFSHPCTAMQPETAGGQVVEESIVPDRLRVSFEQLTLEATLESQKVSLAEDLLNYLSWWSGRTWDQEIIAPATRTGIEKRYWRGEEEYTRTPPPPDAEYVPLVVRDPISHLENLASGVDKHEWSRARVDARTLYRQLKQGIPLLQALPATSVHLQPPHVYSTLFTRIFNPPLLDKEILDDFQSQRPTELVLNKRQETIARVQQLIRDHIARRGFEVVLFGSTRYGVDTFRSDLDLVVLDQNLPEGFTPGTGQNLSKIYSLDPLARAMKRHGFKQVIAIKTAKVPIIKAVDSHTDLVIDININDRLGLYNSTLLEHYCKLWPSLSPLVFTIKRWAKAAALNDPAGQAGPRSFSSYSLTLMTIAWLQYRDILPNLQDFSSTIPEIEPQAVKDRPNQFCIRLDTAGTKVLWCDIRFKCVDPAHWHPSTKLSVGEAFYEWLMFFAHDFDYENLSLSISEGGVLPRRTKNPSIQEVKKKKKKKKGRTQAPNVEEKGVEAGETTEAGPTSVLKLEEQAREQEPRSDHGAEIGAPAQECVERPNQTVEPSEVVGTPEEGVILEEEHMQAALTTAQTLQAEEDALGEELGHRHDVRINREPPKWVENPFLVVDPFIGMKNCAVVNQKMFRIFTAECQRALTVLDAGQGVNEVILAAQAAAEKRIQEKKAGRAQKNSEKAVPPNPEANVGKLQPPPPPQSPVSNARKVPENVAPCPPPATEPSPIPSTRPPRPARQVEASGSNKRRKTRAERRQIPAASSIPSTPESQPAPST